MLEEELETITLTEARLMSIGGTSETSGHPKTELVFEDNSGEQNGIMVTRETAREMAKHLYKTCNITIEIQTK